MTDSLGSYRRTFFLLSLMRSTSCFVLWVEPAADSGLRSSEVIPFDVEFTLGEARHSVRVDVTLDPAEKT